MAQIRRKTIDPAARGYLSLAREAGIGLSWNHYETMLPQDGFNRLGLSCHTCMLGPCRINPFSHNEERTICGFTRGDLVYRRIMDLMGAQPACYEDKINSILEAAGKACEIGDGCREETVNIGLGVLEPDMINICLEKVPPETAASLTWAAARMQDVAEAAGAKGFHVVLSGDVCAGMDTVSSEGEIEFAVLTGLVDAYIVGADALALGRNAASRLHTAVMIDSDSASPEQYLKSAAGAFAKRAQSKIHSSDQVTQTKIVSIDTVIKKLPEYEKAVFIGGGSNIKLVMDDLLVKSVEAFSDSGSLCVVFGNAAAALAKYRLFGENVLCCGDKIGSLYTYRGRLEKLKAAVLLPEISSGRDLACALHLGANGLRVLTATELPVEGDQDLAGQIKNLVSFAADQFVAQAKELLK